MIRYKCNLIELLKNKGYSTYRIKEEKIFNQSQLHQMRHNKLVSQDALNRLCYLLDCQPGNLLEYIPDNKED